MEIRFKDLSFPLKTAIVFTYFVMGIYLGFFIVGFIIGSMGV